MKISALQKLESLTGTEIIPVAYKDYNNYWQNGYIAASLLGNGGGGGGGGGTGDVTMTYLQENYYTKQYIDDIFNTTMNSINQQVSNVNYGSVTAV